MFTDPVIVSSAEALEQTLFASKTTDQKSHTITTTELPSSISSSESESDSDINSDYFSKDPSEHAYEEDSERPEAESTWESLASTVIDPNRVSHNDEHSPYCLPADSYEKVRLDMQRKQFW